MIKWILSCVIICLAILLVRQIFRKKLSLKLQYMLWGLVLIRLLIPFDIGHSRFSIANLFPAGSAEVAGYEEGLRNESFSDGNFEYENLEGMDLEGADLEASEWKASEFGAEGFEYEGFGSNEFGIESLGVMNPAAEILAATNTDASNMKAAGEKSDLTAVLIEGFKLLALIGSIVMGILFLCSYCHFGKKLKRNRILSTKDSDPLPVYLTNAVDTPCLFGLFSPAIYLPEEYSDIPDARTHAVMHEWVHFRHGDHIWAILRTLCLILHWYNPFVWLAAKCSVTDAELACDADTIRILGEESRKSYGNTLISLTDRGNPSLRFSVTAMSSTKKQLKERIQMIVKKPKKNRIITCVTLSFCLVVGGLTFLGAKKQTNENSTPKKDSIKSHAYIKISEISEDEYNKVPVLYNSPVEDVNQDRLVVEEEKTFTSVFTDNAVRPYGSSINEEKRWTNESEVYVRRIIFPLYDSGRYNKSFEIDSELADFLGEPYYMFSANGTITCPDMYLENEEKKEDWFKQIGSGNYLASFRNSDNPNILRYNNRFTIDKSLRDDQDLDELESKMFYKGKIFRHFADVLWMDEDVTKEGNDTYVTGIERMPILYNEAGDQFVVYRMKYFNYAKADKKIGESKSLYFTFHIEKVEDTYAAMLIRSDTAENMKEFQELFVGDPDDENYQTLLNTLTHDFKSDSSDYTPVIDHCKKKNIKIDLIYNISNNYLECSGMVTDKNAHSPYRLIPFHRDNGYWEPYDLSTLGEISE